MGKRNENIVLICTGLGRLNRGFEIYIASLAKKLVEISALKNNIEIWCGGNYNASGIKVRTIPNINRNSWLAKRTGNAIAAFRTEQASFALGMIPKLVSEKPAVLYLGEYQLYCYLFKIRKLLGLKFSLVLYTGGQAIPGLFDEKRDFVHHVTDVYLPQCTHIPGDRQFLVPHFFDDAFEYDNELINKIRVQSKGKRIILSVGLLDTVVKRMDLLVKGLVPLKENVFPVLLGEQASDTGNIEELLRDSFGDEGYIMTKARRNEMGSWYRAADLFVLCSPKESFGLAMVEALYHGLPVICDDFHEAHFVLKDQGHYVKMQGPVDITRAIESSLGNDDTARKEDRKIFTLKHYSWASLSHEYGRMFTRFLQVE